MNLLKRAKLFIYFRIVIPMGLEPMTPTLKVFVLALFVGILLQNQVFTCKKRQTLTPLTAPDRTPKIAHFITNCFA
jgi:hypothetical protein